jgi:hypothetical protein
MFQPTVLIFSTAAAAHHEHIDLMCFFGVISYWLKPSLHPVHSATQPVLIQVAIKIGGLTELNITAIADVAVSVQPRAHDQPLG